MEKFDASEGAGFRTALENIVWESSAGNGSLESKSAHANIYDFIAYR
jgi:hypothetical protein